MPLKAHNLMVENLGSQLMKPYNIPYRWRNQAEKLHYLAKVMQQTNGSHGNISECASSKGYLALGDNSPTAHFIVILLEEFNSFQVAAGFLFYMQSSSFGIAGQLKFHTQT